jgi:hypothetical protein
VGLMPYAFVFLSCVFFGGGWRGLARDGIGYNGMSLVRWSMVEYGAV